MNGTLILAMIVIGSVLLGIGFEKENCSFAIPGIVLTFCGVIAGFFYLMHW